MTWMHRNKLSEDHMREIDRGFLRSAIRSVLWAAFAAKKRDTGLTLTSLADHMGTGKSVVSRWFSGDPNWRINTISDLADALDVDLDVKAIDRKTGRVYTPSGEAPARPEVRTLKVIQTISISDGGAETQSRPATSERMVSLG